VLNTDEGNHDMTEFGGEAEELPSEREPQGGGEDHGFAGPGDGGQPEHGAFLLGGGPAVAGVDYQGEWLRAWAEAQALNQLFTAMGLSGESTVYAQAGWADDGSGLVFTTGTVAGARLLRSALARAPQRGQEPGPSLRPGAGRGWRGRSAGPVG
jgi:hypothetical protein